MERLSQEYADLGGVYRWYNECDFRGDLEAAAALGVSIRTWYRWKNEGLPKGWMKSWIIRRMLEIRSERSGWVPKKLSQ